MSHETESDKKPDKSPKSAPSAIKIKKLIFEKPTDIGGGETVANAVSDNMHQVDNRKRWRVTFIPELRHHKIEFFGLGEEKPSRVFLVHESRCQAEIAL